MDEMFDDINYIRMQDDWDRDDIEALCYYIGVLVEINTKQYEQLKDAIDKLVESKTRLEWYQKQSMILVKG